MTHVSAISLGSGLNLAAFPHLSQTPLSWAWLHLRDLDLFHILEGNKKEEYLGAKAEDLRIQYRSRNPDPMN